MKEILKSQPIGRLGRPEEINSCSNWGASICRSSSLCVTKGISRSAARRISASRVARYFTRQPKYSSKRFARSAGRVSSMRLGFSLVFVPRRPSSVTSAKTASINNPQAPKPSGKGPGDLDNNLIAFLGDPKFFGTAKLFVARQSLDGVAIGAGVQGGEKGRVILVGFDLAHEFPADRRVVGQLANGPPNREGLSRGYEALPTVDRGWQVASAKDGTRGEAD